MSARRVMIYSQDGLGLGHLRRTSTIAERLIAISDVGVLTCMDSPVGPFFNPTERHDHLKLPSVVKEGPGVWRSHALPLDIDRTRRLRARVLRDVTEEFRPDLLLVDHMPHGFGGELVPALEWLRAARPQTRIVLGLRDILDAPEVTERVWREEGADQVLTAFYDMAMIYGDRSVFDAGAVYGFDRLLGDRLHYTGYVGRDVSAIKPKRVTRDQQPLMLAMVGGGADGYEVLRATIEGYLLSPWATTTRLVVVTGPFMPAPLRRDLESRAAHHRIRVKQSIHDIDRYVRAAVAVVAMAGYNSSVELLAAGRPAILVPRRGPSAEQRMRAGLFADRGWVRTVDPDDLTPERMAEALSACLDTSPRDVVRPEPHLLRGRDRTASLLAAALNPPAVALSGLAAGA